MLQWKSHKYVILLWFSTLSSNLRNTWIANNWAILWCLGRCHWFGKPEFLSYVKRERFWLQDVKNIFQNNSLFLTQKKPSGHQRCRQHRTINWWHCWHWKIGFLLKFEKFLLEWIFLKKSFYIPPGGYGAKYLTGLGMVIPRRLLLLLEHLRC